MNLTITEQSPNVLIQESEITIKGLKDKKIMILGRSDVNHDDEADALRLLIIDETDKELQNLTHIVIAKIVNGKVDNFPARLWYGDVNMYITEYNEKDDLVLRPKTCDEWYRFKKSIIINENEQLEIRVVDHKGRISKHKTKMALDATIT